MSNKAVKKDMYSLENWAYNPNNKTFTGIHQVAPTLPSGYYDMSVDMFGTLRVRTIKPRNDQFYEFKGGPLSKVMSEVEQFWTSASLYQKLRMPHKRGVLLHGPPGCGKSGIINLLIQKMIANNGLVFPLGNPGAIPKAYELLRKLEPDRPILFVGEDLDSLIKDVLEEPLLELLDGSSFSGEGLLYVFTTNHLKKIPPRIRCRPSRVDTLIEIGYPDEEHRFEYLSLVLRKTFEGVDSEWTSERLRKLAAETAEFSLATLKELIISLVVYGLSEDDAIKRMRELQRG